MKPCEGCPSGGKERGVAGSGRAPGSRGLGWGEPCPVLPEELGLLEDGLGLERWNGPSYTRPARIGREDGNMALSDDSSPLDREFDLAIREVGLDPETPDERWTFEKGLEVGRRVLPLMSTRPRVVPDLAEELLSTLLEMFPARPEEGARMFQTMFLAPGISKILVGRGLTAHEMALLLRRDHRWVYRAWRKGLGLLYIARRPRARSGVNRRYLGYDDRQIHYELDFHPLEKSGWPEPLDTHKEFLHGMMVGVLAASPDGQPPPWLKEEMVRALGRVFQDPRLSELFDGATHAAIRVAQELRSEVFKMKTERERATKFAAGLSEMLKHKREILEEFAKAGRGFPSKFNLQTAGGP